MSSAKTTDAPYSSTSHGSWISTLSADNGSWSKQYTRDVSDPQTPLLHGIGDVRHNRTALLWRPVVDMADSDLASMRLRFITPVNEWLSDPAGSRWNWFAMIGVPGLRSQVVRHAGLSDYDCRTPEELPETLRTDAWQRLLEAIARFKELDMRRRALVVFQLVQLSYAAYAVRVARKTEPAKDSRHDRFLHEFARAAARVPGAYHLAVKIFATLALEAHEPVVALQACFQGIGHSLRNSKDLEVPLQLEARGREIVVSRASDDWHFALAHSRFRRALALLRLRQGHYEAMGAELSISEELGNQLLKLHRDKWDDLVALENRRIIIESKIKAARSPHYRDSVDLSALCEELADIDPNCVEALLVIADGHATLGDLATAATWYTRAGALGTASGAMGWFRAGICYHLLDDRWSAINAMGHCLELDPAAVEPRMYLEEAFAATPHASPVKHG